MAAEDITRQNQKDTSIAKTRVDDLSHKALTKGKIFVVDQIINALPPPVNVAAKALGEGLYAAFKVRVDAVRQPANPDEDPVKLMAYAMAFAILKAIWCFIKSILNPLPIIGFFFSLCSDDAQLTQGADQATEDARNAAFNDIENGTLNAAVGRFNRDAGTGTAGDRTAALQEAESDLNTSRNRPNPSSGMASGDIGMTFDQFVALTANASAAGPNLDDTASDPTKALQSQTNQAPTTADVPATPDVPPQWQPSEVVSYQEARKLFGL